MKKKLMADIVSMRRNNRKHRTKTADWSKEKKFKHYWNLRMRYLKKALQGVGNLSNKTVYDYTEAEKRKTLQLVREWKKEFVEDKWNKKHVSRSSQQNINLYQEYFLKNK